MRRSLRLIPLALLACADGRPGFELLRQGRAVSIQVVYRSPADPWPASAPLPGPPPKLPRPASLHLIPGMPVPRAPGPHWILAYQFDAPQARAALEALGDEGVLDRALKTPPPPAGPSYLLVIGVYDGRYGGFEEHVSADLGGAAEARKILRAVHARLTGPVAADLEAFLLGLKD
jgi:hypothetical protein